jgi:P2-related tail formation protein
MRIVQMDLERQLKEIQNIGNLYDLRRIPKEFLPYHAALLGTPLPGAEVAQQRAFLRELVATYRRKGTPLSFFKLFEQIGFDLTLAETYQRKRDAATVPGPQMALKSNALIIDEPLGVTVLGQATYKLQTLNNPVTKGTIKLEFFDQSATVPTVIIDDGEGGWSDNIVGSIDYKTGNMEVTLPLTPALDGQPIQITYDHRVDPFPDLDGVLYQDRYRSSLVQFAITPKDPGVSLTPEIIDRIELYLDLLKPAHVIIRNLDLILNFSDTEAATEDLNPHTLQFVDSVFGTLYLGMGWADEDNGSRDPASATFPQAQHRTGPEFIKTPGVFGGDVPYVYPWFLNGIFTQPNATNDYEADWFDKPASSSFSSTVTADVGASATTFSIAKGGGTALGVGDHASFIDGPTGGESRLISNFTDNGTYYTVVVNPAFSVAPAVGNSMRVLDVTAVNLRNLKTGFRQQDPMDIYFGFAFAPAPNGINVGPFTAAITKTPLLAGSTSYLRFTIAATAYEETATATGAFTNVNGFITASAIDYTTGAVSVTFNTAPDNGSRLEVYSTIAAAADVGAY